MPRFMRRRASERETTPDGRLQAADAAVVGKRWSSFGPAGRGRGDDKLAAVERALPLSWGEGEPIPQGTEVREEKEKGRQHQQQRGGVSPMSPGGNRQRSYQ